MIRDILQIGDNILETKSQDINPSQVTSPEIKKLIVDLIDTVKSEISRSAGISAPQIGVNKRIFIARRFDLEKEDSKDQKAKWEVIINPQIISQGKDTSIFWEGCLSVGKGPKALFAPVERKKTTKISYLDENGKTKELTGVGFMSHIFQHELDHLDGVLFLSHVKNPDNIWTSKDLDQYLNTHGDYPPFQD